MKLIIEITEYQLGSTPGAPAADVSIKAEGWEGAGVVEKGMAVLIKEAIHMALDGLSDADGVKAIARGVDPSKS